MTRHAMSTGWMRAHGGLGRQGSMSTSHVRLAAAPHSPQAQTNAAAARHLIHPPPPLHGAEEEVHGRRDVGVLELHDAVHLGSQKKGSRGRGAARRSGALRLARVSEAR